MLGNKSCKASNYLKLIILISIFVITTVVAVSCDKKGQTHRQRRTGRN